MVTLTPTPTAPQGRTPFQLMSKPIGPICNLDCSYCFYLEKEKLYPATERWRMSEAVLESYIRQYIEAQDADEIGFAWQGGEPTLLGVDFFRGALQTQKRHANGKRIRNAFQTNGVLLDEEWCRFLRDNEFLVGISIDGPRELHDTYRVDKKGEPTFDAVERGLKLLKGFGVEFNTLTVVNRTNASKPREVYQYLSRVGSGHMQFIPLVERAAVQTQMTVNGLSLAEPPVLDSRAPAAEGPPVTPWSVLPDQYGEFLVSIFDQWIRRDVGRVFVQFFEVTLGHWLGAPSSLCLFSEKCGRAAAIEHNGDVYSCDHFVYPRYRLGNVLETPLREMLDSPQQRKFGDDKLDTLPRYCRECDVRFACHGECPKHRFATTPDGEAGLNYLCAAYKRFFHHAAPHMKDMAQLIRSGREASDIVPLIQERERYRKPTSRR